MPLSRRDRIVGFRLEADVAEFVRIHGGARKTDLAAGKLNCSAEVNELIRAHLMSQVSPETIGYRLAREKEELRLAMEAIDHQAQELLGVSTIEEWIAREKDRQRSEGEVLEAQREIRVSVKTEIVEELKAAWSTRHDNGRAFKRDQDVAWARHRFQNQLRTLGWTPEEFVKRMQPAKDRVPEVA
jgi:hypothetical protein